MKVVDRKLSELVPSEYNPRYISEEQLSQLKASIQRFETVEPVLVNMHPDRKNIIISGHQRIKAAKSLGMTEFPCVELNLDKDKERELNIRMNKNTGGWDWDELANHFDTEELTEWGFTEEELFGDGAFGEEEPEAKEDYYEIPEEIHTDFVLGDLIEIGEHRLLCGDSTDAEQVDKLMNGEKADMVFTDPPYGIDLNTNYADIHKNHIGEAKNQSKIIGDEEDFNFLGFYSLFEYVKEQFWWGADYYKNQIPKEGCFLVWDKTLGEHKDRIGNEFEICWSKQTHKKIIDRIKWVGFIGLQKNDGKRQHPSQKPVELCFRYIKDYSKENYVIIDLFLGSGSTMVACHQLNRKCYGMELDESYCEVIVQRMLKLDSSLTILVNGEDKTQSFLDKI